LISTDFAEYMQIPFRKTLHKNLEICLNISDEFAPFPQPPIDFKQFFGCVNDLTSWAVEESKIRELSGTVSPSESFQALDRDLNKPAWRVINTIQSQVAQEDCLTEMHQLASPIEWMMAAESLMWFADRWPAYMNFDFENSDIPEPSNYVNPKQQFRNVILEGEKLQKGFSCQSQSKKLIFDNIFSDIKKVWQQVELEITKVQNEFIASNLKVASDVDLLGTFEQDSTYKVQGALIQACDVKTACGIYVELDTSREIYKLFPKHLLLADQLKLGSLKLCYDNVGWENRRATATHLDNENVANYVGNLSFHLKGYYEEQLAFDRKITSKAENLYLFGKNDDSVLNKYCPVDIVGEQITTQLKRGTYGLVPNRLTFLTASRADESKILQNNWQQGEEWQDKIVNDEAVEIVANNLLEEYKESVQLSFNEKSTELQNTIYNSLLRKQVEPTETQQQLSESYAEMNQLIKLYSSLFMVFSDDYITDDTIHGLLFGATNLPSMQSINEWHNKQIGIKQMMLMMQLRLSENKQMIDQIGEFRPWYSINDILFRLRQY
jgi:hypothetical protein